MFALYVESQMPGSFQKSVDEMFKENGLPKVNFPQQIVTNEFKNLLNQSKNNIVEEISTVNENIVEHVSTTNVMETEQTDHGFKRALEKSPEAPIKKREMAITSMATSNSGNIAMRAPNASSQILQPLSLSLPLPQRVPRTGRAIENPRSRSTSREWKPQPEKRKISI